jgi:dipeptidyl aminopeptidase/acylaminoacyl peptidase
MFARCSTIFLLLASAPLRGASRPPIESVVASLRKIQSFAEVAVSPDGRFVAWVQGDRDLGPSTISLLERGRGEARRVTAAPDGKIHEERGLAFSPDSGTLAFLSDAGHDGERQLYLAPVRGGPPRQLTRAVGQMASPRWSPNGKSIAVLFIEGSAQAPGALVAYTPDSGVVGEKIDEQRIAVVDTGSGQLRQASPPHLFVYDYDWSPDGSAFAAEAVEGSGTDNYWSAELYFVSLASGEARSLWKPPLQIANPRFSPDGASVACIHGLMSDEGVTGGDVYLVPVTGGPARNLTPGMSASASWLAWRGSGDILFAELVDGEEGLATVDPGSGTVKTLWHGAEALPHISLSHGSASAVVLSSFRHPEEVWAGSIGDWTALTHINGEVSPLWGEAKSLHFSSDDLRVQGWLLCPKDYDPEKRYPLAVSVHGGPSGAVSPAWPGKWGAVLPSQGYCVFLPNPRGSYGFGESFTQANVKDFGYGDLRDILAGVDEVSRTIHVKEVGIVGWSYGGYMAMWAVTQTNRFKAAVAGAGIVSWQSYYGQNRIDRWMIPFFGASVYDDPGVYARSSPITFIKQVKTPTLVLHGDRDSEVPTPQGYEFWHALKSLNVPTELVIYSNEGHSIRAPEHQLDIMKRLVAWLDRYLE